jgi:hypothetical protein
MPQRGPLIRSRVLLRAIASAATLTSLASMSAFAATHVQNDAAPLKPTASTTTSSTIAAATPVPTAATTTSRATALTGRVTTTTTTARTKTHSS